MSERFKTTVSAIELPDFEARREAAGEGEQQGSLEKISDIYVELIVKLGKASVTVGDVQRLKIGDILEVEKKLGHKVDIYLGEKRVGIGEAVVMDDNFGIVISEINTGHKKKTEA